IFALLRVAPIGVGKKVFVSLDVECEGGSVSGGVWGGCIEGHEGPFLLSDRRSPLVGEKRTFIEQNRRKINEIRNLLLYQLGLIATFGASAVARAIRHAMSWMWRWAQGQRLVCRKPENFDQPPKRDKV
ncbi:MAG: hypothetical protein P1U62_14850, partial [Alteraurantiacibacter sp. bin_em_oilr2.035]|nr:hypothetical protein [Alteraurantiacibacter sp. bin_em_oilr2.035]